MTRNMDEGTGFIYLLAAMSLPEFLDAVTSTYQEVQASQPSQRAVAVAARNFVGLHVKMRLMVVAG